MVEVQDVQEPKLLRPCQAATALGITTTTLRAWVRCGFISGVELTQGRHLRVPASEIARIKRRVAIEFGSYDPYDDPNALHGTPADFDPNAPDEPRTLSPKLANLFKKPKEVVKL